jgi:hypothetical protein
VDRHDILDGKCPVLDSARRLIHELGEHSREVSFDRAGGLTIVCPSKGPCRNR